MKRLHVTVFICITGILVILSGCSTIRKNEATQSYRELVNTPLDYNERSNTRAKAPELKDNSTLSDFLVYAALNNPELEAAFNRWKASLEKIPQVQTLPDPRFTYSYFIEEIETRVGPQRHRFDISQTFPWFGKLSLLGDLALQDANIKKQAYETLKLRLFYRIKTAYYEYYYLSRALEITEDNMKLLTSLEEVARSKYTSGKATYADVIKSQVEIGKLEERLLSLNDQKEPITAELNAVLNRSSDAPLPSNLSLPEEALTLSDTLIFVRLKEFNPELKSLNFQALRETKAVELAKKQFYPDISLGLNYIETGKSRMSGIPESGKDPVIGMFTVNLPLWRNKYHASVREALMIKKSVEKALTARENTLNAELKRALYNYRDSERKVDLYKNTLIPKARESLNVSLQAFETGKADFLSLIDAQRTLLEFELSYERALSDRARHYANIELLVGDSYTGMKK